MARRSRPTEVNEALAAAAAAAVQASGGNLTDEQRAEFQQQLLDWPDPHPGGHTACAQARLPRDRMRSSRRRSRASRPSRSMASSMPPVARSRLTRAGHHRSRPTSADLRRSQLANQLLGTIGCQRFPHAGRDQAPAGVCRMKSARCASRCSQPEKFAGRRRRWSRRHRGLLQGQCRRSSRCRSRCSWPMPSCRWPMWPQAVQVTDDAAARALRAGQGHAT